MSGKKPQHARLHGGSRAFHPQGQVHVAILYSNPLYNVAVSWDFVAGDLMRKVVTRRGDGAESISVRMYGRLKGLFQ